MESQHSRHATKPLSVWERVSFSATHALARCLLMLLGLKGLYRFGRAFGTIEWLINYKRRRRFRRKLGEIYQGDLTGTDARAAARENFMRIRCDKLFYLLFDCIPRDRAISLFSISNREWLDDALADGRGVYVALSHDGAQHVAAMFLALLGYKVAGVRDPMESGIRRYVQERFDRKYPEFRRFRVLYADSYPRDVLRCLQEGYVLGSLMDINRIRSTHQKTIELTMFGKKRPFLTGPLRLAVRSRVPVIQGFIISERDFHYRLELVHRLIEPHHEGEIDVALHGALSTYARNIETRIRTTPSLVSRL